ncbi:glutathione S-transferase family protein [Tasmannia lanceolata]|uniref:glutathione S-transferase family protein n=1 Tax=Tasmannia lanceolata TaxID=3420 RepID=UPI00406384C9
MFLIVEESKSKRAQKMPTSLLLPVSLPLPNIHRKSKKPNNGNVCHVSPRIRMSHQTPNSDLLTTISRLFWGKSLPPQLLISTVRYTWNSTWHLMMRQLAPSDPSGSYSRPTSNFRSNSSSRQKTRPINLHLYAALACPWAHRTLIVRALKNLEDAIPTSIASAGLDGSWEFSGAGVVAAGQVLAPSSDRANGCKTLKEVYRLRKGGYDGRSTVPMLWDMEKRDVFCNESYDIIEFFNSGFDGSEGDSGLDLNPPSLKGKIEYWNQIIYPTVNNGVYRCGFAQSQEAYDVAVNGLFSTLEMLEAHLATSRYLCGDALTLADICLFTTLIRFDLVYNVLFKCTKKKLLEYPNLHGYTRDIYQIPKVAATCDFNAIMDGYYRILFPLNPGSIRPALPSGCEHESLAKLHNRESLVLMGKQSQVFVS